MIYPSRMQFCWFITIKENSSKWIKSLVLQHQRFKNNKDKIIDTSNSTVPSMRTIKHRYMQAPTPCQTYFSRYTSVLLWKEFEPGIVIVTASDFEYCAK